MKKILLAGAFAALATSAVAADLPSRRAPVAYAPVAAPIFTWAGLYVGADVGYAWGKDSGKAYNAGGVFQGRDKVSSKGLLGGLYAGYNWQSGALVYGLEADIEAANVRNSITAFSGDYVNARIGTQGSVRGRIGYAIDRTLLYVTGGVAAASIKTSYQLAGAAGLDSISKTRFGWTLGAGAEYAITNNIIARAEYRYTDFGKKSDGLVATYPNFTVKRTDTDHAVRLGVSYKFGGPSAIVAKY